MFRVVLFCLDRDLPDLGDTVLSGSDFTDATISFKAASTFVKVNHVANK